MSKTKSSTKKKLMIAIPVIAVAVLCFCVSSLFLDPMSITSKLSKSYADNEPSTATKCDVDLNGNEKVFDENTVIEPGMTLSKTFYIQNNDEETVAYGFEGDSGNLSKALDVKIVSDGVTLYSGKASELENFNSSKAYTLASGERKDFEITLAYPESAGNATANMEFNFTIGCDYAN